MKIISGGQSGVDRAALDFCLEHGLPCGGWCPKGRIAEDGVISKKYPLRESETEDYSERTSLNVNDSDATLILFNGKMDVGTNYTVEVAEELNKPYFIVNFSVDINISEIEEWLDRQNISTLNIAGSRESNSPGIYDESLLFLNNLLPALIKT